MATGGGERGANHNNNDTMADNNSEECVTQGFGKTILANLHQFYQEGMLCDFKIKVESKQFEAHRVILAGCSDYFRALLSHEMIETRENFTDLKSLTVKGFEPLLKYFYTGSLTLNLEIIQDVIGAAIFLQVTSAIDMCIDFIKRKMTFENASDLLCIGDVFSIESLRPYYRNFVMKNFCDFAETDIFLKLDVEILEDYLLDDALKVPSEAKLFEFVLRWYNHDPEERKQYAFIVFDKVRYVVHGWPAIHIASRCELFQTNQKCKEILKFCEDYMANAEKRYTFYDHRTRARYNKKTLVQIGGITKWSNTYSEGMSFYPIYHEDMECGWDLNNYYHSESGIWLPLGCMANLNMMSHCTITEINDFGIVCGGFLYDIESDGFVDHAPTKGVKMFQSSGMSYFELDDLKHARGCHAAAYLQGCLYVIGGKDNRQPLASVEALNNDEGKWKYVKPLPKPLFEHAAAACGGKIYVSGGVENREVTNKVWCYDPILNKWYKRAPMLTARSSHGMVSFRDKLYACGGRRSMSLKSCLTSMEMYIPEENAWKHLTPMRHDAAHVSLAVMNDKILVCGGEDSKSFLIDLIQQYDPVKDEWSIYSTLPRPLRGLACCALTINQDRLSYDDDSDNESNVSTHLFSLDDFGDSMDDSS